MPEIAPCLVCGGGAFAPYHETGDYQTYRCAGCGLVFVHPMPNTDDLAAFYNAHEGYISKPESRLRRARRRLRRFRNYRRSGRFLDIGCSGGFIAEAAREAGFEAHGIDISQTSIDFARAHYPENTYLCGDFISADLAERRFDAVYSSELIEHLIDPNPFLARIAQVMAPGAVLFLTTPDHGHWRRPRDLSKWICPPFHLTYFSQANLYHLLERHGFRVLKRERNMKPGIKVYVTLA